MCFRGLDEVDLMCVLSFSEDGLASNKGSDLHVGNEMMHNLIVSVVVCLVVVEEVVHHLYLGLHALTYEFLLKVLGQQREESVLLESKVGTVQEVVRPVHVKVVNRR